MNLSAIAYPFRSLAVMGGADISINKKNKYPIFFGEIDKRKTRTELFAATVEISLNVSLKIKWVDICRDLKG